MIKINNISFSYKKHKVLKDISFEVPDGECVGIIGANGCGKSTLLSILAGSRKQRSGQIEGISQSDIGYVPQDNPLIPDLTAYDNLLLWYKGSRASLGKELNNDLIKMLGIDSFLHKQVKRLSGGMKKRVSIAIALLSKPKLLILDEPSAALDLPCKQDIKYYLREYLSTGGSVIITTHDEDELDLCSHLLVIKDSHLKEIDAGLRGEELTKQL